MRKLRKMASLLAAIAAVLTMNVLHATVSLAETVNQDPFDFVIVGGQDYGGWTSPKYPSSTGAAYACTTVSVDKGDVKYWQVEFFVHQPAPINSTSTLWTSPKETSAPKHICSPYTQEIPNSTFWVRIRAYPILVGNGGEISGTNDIYTDFVCGPTICGGAKPR